MNYPAPQQWPPQPVQQQQQQMHQQPLLHPQHQQHQHQPPPPPLPVAPQTQHQAPQMGYPTPPAPAPQQWPPQPAQPQYHQPPAMNYQPVSSPQQWPPQPQSYMPPPGHNNAQSAQTARQLNLEAMPSVAAMVRDEIQEFASKPQQLRTTAPATLPPLATTLESRKLNILMEDNGCARPCNMRSTIYQVPTTKAILDSSGLDFSVLVKPFDVGELEGKFYIPLSQSEIVRCNRCKAYANPYSKSGQCCICGFDNLDQQNINQRPELNFGSYEFRVTPEYYRNEIPETRRPHIIFAMELTDNSRHMIMHLSKHLPEVIKSHLPSDFLYSTSLPPLVGFVTYNSKITLYDVMNGGHAYVISDMTSVADCATISKFLVDPAKNFEEIEKFLNSLADVYARGDESEPQTVLGPAVEAALKACLHDTSNFFQFDQKKTPNRKVIPAGKVYLFHSSLPVAGDETTPGRLAPKRNLEDMKRKLGTENESKALIVEDKYYTELAQKCVADYASGVELFLLPPDPRVHLNIATLSELSRITGTGFINKYHINTLDNFIEDLKFSLKSTMGFDASMRVRTSTGISPIKYIGNFNNLLGSNLEMAALSTSSNFIVQMKYDDKLPENNLVVIQFAMIYTSVCGERRVRVHNLALSTCQLLSDLYKTSCCDTLVNSWIRETIDKMRAGTLNPITAKEYLTTRVINVLAAYRKHCTDSHTSTSSQLILPEGLKLLPIYLCGALKCDAIDGGMELFPDDKVLAQVTLLGALPTHSQVTVYPRMYLIEPCEANDEENTLGLQAVLTRCYSLAIEEAKGHCYIVENGHYLFIYFPNTELGQSFLASVFGSRKDDPVVDWKLRQTDTNESKFLEELIAQIVLERRRALKIHVIRQARDKFENVFKSFLYEDKKRMDGVISTNKLDNVSYVDLLCYLHNEIRSKLSQ